MWFKFRFFRISPLIKIHNNFPLLLENTLTLPRTYGVDDIPIIVQTKAFDVLKQIAIASNMDTAVFVNGTLNPFFNAPAQVIRFRLLNGSSLRSYNFGFSNGQTFYQIATDSGLLDASLALTRITLSPGERAEILVNFSVMQSQTIYMKSFASELPNGIYGATTVGFGADIIGEYTDNFLNGADFNLLQLNIVSQTGSPVDAEHDPDGVMGWVDSSGKPTKTHPAVALSARAMLNKEER